MLDGFIDINITSDIFKKVHLGLFDNICRESIFMAI